MRRDQDHAYFYFSPVNARLSKKKRQKKFYGLENFTLRWCIKWGMQVKQPTKLLKVTFKNVIKAFSPKSFPEVFTGTLTANIKADMYRRVRKDREFMSVIMRLCRYYLQASVCSLRRHQWTICEYLEREVLHLEIWCSSTAICACCHEICILEWTNHTFIVMNYFRPSSNSRYSK